MRAGKGPRIVGLKQGGKFILLHIGPHDEAQKWAERQNRQIDYEVAVISEEAAADAFNVQNNTGLSPNAEAASSGVNQEGNEDSIFDEFAEDEKRLISKLNAAESERLEAIFERDQAETERDAAIEQRDAAIEQRNVLKAELERQSLNLQTVQSFSGQEITGFSENEILEDVFVIFDRGKKAIALKLLNNDKLRLNNWHEGFDSLLLECKKQIGNRIRTDVWGNYSPNDWFQNIYLVSIEKTNESVALGTRQNRTYFRQANKDKE